MTQSSNLEWQREFYKVGCQRAREHLIDFCIHTDKRYDPNWHHEVIGEALEKIENGTLDRLILTIPPRFGKSEIASIKFPAWYLGRNPDKNIITASYSADLAVSFGRKTRNLVNSPVYSDVFKVKLARDSKSADVWHTDEGGEYTATGVGGSATGKGANILLIDDPFKNREEAESPTIRAKVWDWFTSVAYTRLEKDGAIVLIQTRWHGDDLAGRLLSDNKDNWTHISFPAIAEKDEEYRKEGEPLWPKKYTLEALLRIKENIGPYDWGALYQQTPVNKESQEFKQDWFKYYDKAPENLSVFLTVDPAISKKEKACNSVVIVCGVSDTFDMYILDYVAGRYNPGELIDQIMSMAAVWQPTVVGIESIAYQQSISYYLQRQMEETKMWLNVKELRPTADKEQRIRRLVPFYRGGKVYHKRSYMALEEELLNFPSSSKVDIIDALAMQLDIMYMPDATPNKEIKVPYANDPYAPWNRDKQKGISYNNFYSYR